MKEQAAFRGVVFLILPASLAVTACAAGAGASGGTTPPWFSLLPPLLSIVVALALRNVIVALFAGVWLGAWGICGLSLDGFWRGLLAVADVHVRGALADEDHAAILIFSFLIAGMVGIIRRNGGLDGAVRRVVRRVDSRRGGQVATVALGLAVFFDDYANLLVAGNAMKPVARRLRISPAKLAYLIDSTAAPVACLAFATTWIGFEVGLIGDATRGLGDLGTGPYGIFLRTLPYSFYPILTLVSVFAIAVSGRDFGPMYTSESRALAGPPDPSGEAKPAARNRSPRALNAVVPIAVLVGSLLVGLLVTGRAETGANASFGATIGAGDSFRSLLWASLLSVLVAGTLTLAQRLLSLDEIVEAWADGLSSLLFGLTTLVLAWALAGITEALGTGTYLASLLGTGFPDGLLPPLIFVLAALTGFATGSAWGTMAILMPVAVPTAWAQLATGGELSAATAPIFYSVIAAVLGGGVFGDHCSPISDTTVLSSAVSGCSHVEHVRTQLPYALVAGAATLAASAATAIAGLNPWLAIGLGVVAITLLVRWRGRHPTPPPPGVGHEKNS